MDKIFEKRYGIIPSCDFFSLDKLEQLLVATSGMDCVHGYKIGMYLAASHGLPKAIETIRRYSSAPIIYDHQKFGTDIPEICVGVLNFLKECGVDSVIIFPQAGKETLTATVKGCWAEGLLPVVGGEMTHRGYLVKEGGYLENNSPLKIYTDAARLGVNHFVVPGTKPRVLRNYDRKLSKLVDDPVYLIPGIGKGQGGSLQLITKVLKGRRIFPIIGRGIYEATDMGAAVEEYGKEMAS